MFENCLFIGYLPLSQIPPPCYFLMLSIFWHVWRTPDRNPEDWGKKTMYIGGEKWITTTKEHGLSNLLSNFCISCASVCLWKYLSFITKLCLAENQAPPVMIVANHPPLKNTQLYLRPDSVQFQLPAFEWHHIISFYLLDWNKHIVLKMPPKCRYWQAVTKSLVKFLLH